VLVIRPEQLDAFREDRERHFHRRLTALLRRLLGDGYEVTEEIVAWGIARARVHGVRSETAIADFTGLVVQLGGDFDQHALVRSILSDDRLTPNERVDALFARLTFDDWKEVFESSDGLSG